MLTTSKVEDVTLATARILKDVNSAVLDSLNSKVMKTLLLDNTTDAFNDIFDGTNT